MVPIAKPPSRREPITGLWVPLACVALGLGLSWFLAGKEDKQAPPAYTAPVDPAPGSQDTVSHLPAPPPAVPDSQTPHPATYRGDMGLTGVFSSPCPAAPVSVRWRAAAGGTPAGGVVWDGARFLVALAEGTVLALDSRGNEVWRRGAALEGIAAPPVTDGTRCFVVGPKGTLAAFRSADGELLWRAVAPVDFPVQNAPVLTQDGLIAISQSDGRLLSVRPEDGTVQWVGEPAARCDGPISAGSNAVFFGHCDAAVQLHASATGMLLATVPLGDDAQVAGAVAVRGSRAAFGTRSGDVVMLDTIRHTVLWRTPLEDGEVFSAPVLSADLVVVTTASAEVIALSVSDGTERWRHRTGLQSATSPILVQDCVVLGAAGSVMALDAATGDVRWRISVGDATTEPCAGAGLIVVGTDEGDIVAIGSSN